MNFRFLRQLPYELHEALIRIMYLPSPFFGILSLVSGIVDDDGRAKSYGVPTYITKIALVKFMGCLNV